MLDYIIEISVEDFGFILHTRPKVGIVGQGKVVIYTVTFRFLGKILGASHFKIFQWQECNYVVISSISLESGSL